MSTEQQVEPTSGWIHDYRCTVPLIGEAEVSYMFSIPNWHLDRVLKLIARQISKADIQLLRHGSLVAAAHYLHLSSAKAIGKMGCTQMRVALEHIHSFMARNRCDFYISEISILEKPASRFVSEIVKP